VNAIRTTRATPSSRAVINGVALLLRLPAPWLLHRQDRPVLSYVVGICSRQPVLAPSHERKAWPIKGGSRHQGRRTDYPRIARYRGQARWHERLRASEVFRIGRRLGPPSGAGLIDQDTTSGAGFDKRCTTQGIVVDSPENGAIDGPIQGPGSRLGQTAVRYGDEHRRGVAHQRTTMQSYVQLVSADDYLAAIDDCRAVRFIARRNTPAD
jgi:hypothetical protein